MYSRCVYMILCAALAHRCIIAVYLCVCIGLHMGVNFLMHMLLHSDIDETYTHMHTCVQTSTEGTIESDGAGGGDLVWRTALTTTISREDTTCAIKAGHDRQKEENLQASGAPWQVVALATITSSSSTFTCASLVRGACDHETIRQCASSIGQCASCLLYTSPSPRDRQKSRMPSSA